MAFSKAEILTLCETIARDLEASDTIDDFFDEVVYALADHPIPPLIGDSLVSLTAGTETYSFETDMIRLLYAIMDDSSLFMTDEDGLQAYSNSWRATSGTPIAITEDNLQNQYTLYPNPSDTTGAIVGPEPLGEDYPDDPLYIIYAEYRDASIPDHYALPIALSTLSKEFSFSSLHTDIEFASLCNQLSNLIMKMLRH